MLEEFCDHSSSRSCCGGSGLGGACEIDGEVELRGVEGI